MRKTQESTAAFVVGHALHRIGNPAAAVKSNVGYLVDGLQELAAAGFGAGAVPSQAAAEVQSKVRDLLVAATETRDAVDDLALCLESLRRGDVDFRTGANANVGDLARVAVDLLRVEIDAHARLELALDADAVVVADGASFLHVILNLLLHVCDAISPGDVDENVIRLATWTSGTRAGLTVEDTGSRFSPAERAKQFKPFDADDGRKPAARMGLAIARDLLERLGGKLRLAGRQQGPGAVFSLDLPRADLG